MPLHDWTRVNAGIYHDFHLSWVGELKRAVNAELPEETHFAFIEPSTWEGLEIVPNDALPAIEDSVAEDAYYADKRRRIAIFRTSDQKRCAMIEFAGPVEHRLCRLNDIARFVASRLTRSHAVLLIDFAAGVRSESDNVLGRVLNSLGVSSDSRLPSMHMFAASLVLHGREVKIHAATLTVGAPLPQIPLYFDEDRFVSISLENTYERAFSNVPRRWQRVIEARSRASSDDTQ